MSTASARWAASPASRPGRAAREYLSFRAARTGLHYVQVKLGSRGEGRYKLVIIKA